MEEKDLQDLWPEFSNFLILGLIMLYHNSARQDNIRVHNLHIDTHK